MDADKFMYYQELVPYTRPEYNLYVFVQILIGLNNWLLIKLSRLWAWLKLIGLYIILIKKASVLVHKFYSFFGY